MGVITLSVFLVGSNQPLAAAESGAPVIDNERFMFIEEVKPGMKGYGLTVFAGTEIERFDVEILSVLYGFEPKSDLILARVSGGPIEKAGVIAGMSGSPIYIEGRIIGALAYSWAFSKEPIAGVTPIGEMLEIFAFEKARDSRSASVGMRGGGGWAEAARFAVPLPATVAESAAMQPIMTPVVFSGFSREAVEWFRPQLGGWGIVPVAGGSFSERLSGADAPFEEGAAVGIQLVRGDMNAAAIGTLTLKQGERVLAFGHPFLFSGSVEFPMTTAFVHTVLPSLVVSSKVGSPLKPVGTLTQDRRTGIAGIIGDTTTMVPLSLRVNGAETTGAKEFNFEVAMDRQMLPAMAAMALASALMHTNSYRGEFSAAIHYEIEIAEFPTIRNDDFITGLGGLPSLAALGLFRDLNMLLNNEFEKLTLKGISIEVDARSAVESASITGVRIHKDTLRPGEEVELRIAMKPYMGELVHKQYVIRIPEHFPEGQAFLQVSAAPQTASFEKMRTPLRFRPRSIEQLIKLVDEDYPGNRLDIRLLVADPGIVVGGEELSALPSSVFSVLSQSIGKETTGITRASVLFHEHTFMDFEVGGSSILPLTIKRTIK